MRALGRLSGPLFIAVALALVAGVAGAGGASTAAKARGANAAERSAYANRLTDAIQTDQAVVRQSDQANRGEGGVWLHAVMHGLLALAAIAVAAITPRARNTRRGDERGCSPARLRAPPTPLLV